MPSGKHWQNETQFTNAVVDLFKMSGWLVHHDRGEMRKHIQGHVGFPDIFAVHPKLERAVAAELKMPRGRGSIEQFQWLDALGSMHSPGQASPVHVYYWKPDDWDEIVLVATGRSSSEP